MAISIEDARQFITDCEEARKEWLSVARRSWREINKQNKQRNLWSATPNSARRRVRFPIWRSTLKIRQPLHYARTPTLIGKDCTGGDDPTGRTAAILLERLGYGILKTFDFDSVMNDCRDDALVTNFGAARPFFDCVEIEEPKQIPVVEEQDDQGNVTYTDEAGDPVDAAKVQQSEDGPYIETSEVVSVESERVYLEHTLYSDVFIDPDARRWAKKKKLAFATEYTLREFKQIFGEDAAATLSTQDYKETGKKRKQVRVFELWDILDEACYWFAENGKDFIKPVKAPEDDDADLYDLEGFFPMPQPMIWNAPTDTLYPVPEYVQLQDLIEDIHNLFSQMFSLTKAIRPRLLFDDSIPELKPLINEVGGGDALAVPNLTQSLAAGGGGLDAMVAYLPIEKMVAALENVYKAFSQRLEVYYQLTGISDILRGQTDNTERTFGEQQMKAKYGLNQSAESQKDMQRFARDCIEMLCEMGIKNFSDETLSQYIVPATLEADDKQRYEAALELLKSDKKRRFRIEIETDSTIAINEDYDKQSRIEVVNTITGALEKTVNIAKEDSTLATVELKLLLHLIRGFRQGKLFEDEVTEAIQAAIQKAEEASQQPPQPDINQQRLQLDGESLKATMQRNADDAAAKMATINATVEKDRADVQLRYSDSQTKAQELQLEYQKLQQAFEIAQADFQLRQLELQIAREKNQIEAQKIGNDALLKQNRLEIDAQIAQSEANLGQMAQSLEQYKVQLDEKEKYMTEYRLQHEAQLEQMRMQIEASKPTQQQPTMPPIINQIMQPQAAPTRRVTRAIRDEQGNITGSEAIDLPLEQPTMAPGVPNDGSPIVA